MSHHGKPIYTTLIKKPEDDSDDNSLFYIRIEGGDGSAVDIDPSDIDCAFTGSKSGNNAPAFLQKLPWGLDWVYAFSFDAPKEDEYMGDVNLEGRSLLPHPLRIIAYEIDPHFSQLSPRDIQPKTGKPLHLGVVLRGPKGKPIKHGGANVKVNVEGGNGNAYHLKPKVSPFSLFSFFFTCYLGSS